MRLLSQIRSPITLALATLALCTSQAWAKGCLTQGGNCGACVYIAAPLKIVNYPVATIFSGIASVGGGAGTMTINPDNSYSFTGGLYHVHVPLIDQNGHSAYLPDRIEAMGITLSGQPGYCFHVLAPTSATITSLADWPQVPEAFMTIDQITFSSNLVMDKQMATGVLSNPGGSIVFTVGSTLHIATNQPKGSYAGNFTVTVQYD